MYTFIQFLCFIGTDFFPHLYYLVGCFLKYDCLDTTVLGVLCACVLYFLYLCLFSAVEHVSHGKAL